MLQKITNFAEFFRKIPSAFLVAIVSVLGLILFIPEELAKTLAVNGFREQYRVYLGPAFLLAVSFCFARLFMFSKGLVEEKKRIANRQKTLHHLTAEEKGYLVTYIKGGQNTVYVGMDDGIMMGLVAKGVTYCASSEGSILDGFAFNLQPWARSYLEQHPDLLGGYTGRPMTPQEKLFSRY